jgi:hypothetical protein
MSSLQRSQSVAHNLDIRPLAGRIGAEIAVSGPSANW